MYNPLIKAFNYALDRLSKFDVPGLPEFQDEPKIVFARSDTKCIGSEHYLQGSYKPDIVLVKWKTFESTYGHKNSTYAESYKCDTCCESNQKEPALSWRNILSTIEVKRDGSGGAGKGGNQRSKGKAREKSVKSVYTADFWDLEGDLGAVGSSKLQQPAPLKMVDEEFTTRSRMSIVRFLFLYILISFSWDTRWPENSKYPNLDFGSADLITEEAQRSARH